ncbi:hypothetical protein HDU83_008338 [Entophlyctis luteolus]|nr:hypothetical protein HDU83_008338 [Entophlyctis luteolus]
MFSCPCCTRDPDAAAARRRVHNEETHTSHGSPRVGFGSPNSARDSTSTTNTTTAEDDSAPPVTRAITHNRNRRASVSAESMSPSTIMQSVGSNVQPVVVPKTDAQRERISKAIAQNILFSACDAEQLNSVVDAMIEKYVAPEVEVITQGDAGDFFYVVESGQLDVFVKKPHMSSGRGDKVWSYSAGGCFGELALMYNAPRAATVVSVSDCILWALDRITFRSILMNHTAQKRRMYEGFLEEVKLLATLEPYERSKIADTLETQTFENGETVINQGDVGDRFYMIESGEASVTKVTNGIESSFPKLKKGDHFGGV